nr:putative RdRp [Linepithema humile partiti-like virus 1]
MPLNSNTTSTNRGQRRPEGTVPVSSTSQEVRNEASTSSVQSPTATQASVQKDPPRRKRFVGRPRPPRQLDAKPQVPKPAFLSTTATPIKNDPLYMSALVPHPGAELRPTSSSKHIQSSAIGITDVSTQIYQELVANSTGFARRVPSSAFQCYAATLVFAAMLKKHESNGFNLKTAEREFSNSVIDAKLKPPTMLTSYMDGFGNTTLPSGRELIFRMLPRNYVEDETTGTIGWFGKVDPQTHYMYMEYPNLAVYMYRITQDIRYTANRDLDPDWNLPGDIAPAEALNAGLPNVNLLGYHSAEALKPEQVRFLRESGMTANGDFVSDNDVIPVNLGLLLAVQNEIDAVTKAVSTKLPNYAIDGSQAQIPLVHPLHTKDRRLEKHQDLELTSPVQINGALVVIDGGFVYRMRHHITEQVRETNNWSIYNFTHFTGVPPTWRNTANTIRSDEDELLQVAEFRTVPHNLKARIHDIGAAFKPVA